VTNRPIRPIAAMLLAASAGGCSLITGAACLSRPQRAHVTTIAARHRHRA
jgi:hypothetical protein